MHIAQLVITQKEEHSVEYHMLGASQRGGPSVLPVVRLCFSFIDLFPQFLGLWFPGCS